MGDTPLAGSAGGGGAGVASAASADASSTVRLKPLVMNIYQTEREIGTFPNTAFSDIRHCFDMLRRGKAITLGPARIAEVERLLCEHTATLKTLSDVEEQLKQWKTEYLGSWDADAYYNSHRVESYTDWNKVPQFRLASSCYALSGLARSGESWLVLDIACGSGLSSQVFQSAGHFVIGTDLSRAMLEQHKGAGDVVLADMGQPLPFRPGVFDAAYSVSAIHYLCRGEDEGYTGKRMDDFFGTLHDSLASPSPPVLCGSGGIAAAEGDSRAGDERQKRLAQAPSAELEADAKRPRACGDVTVACESEAMTTKETTQQQQQQTPPPAAAAAPGPDNPAAVPEAGLAVAQYYPESLAERDQLVANAEKHGFVACPIVDNVHESASRRHFLALFKDGRGRRCGPAPVCALYDKDQAACIIAFEAWARGHGLCDPLLPAEHRAWVINEHAKCARKLIRSLKRIKAVAAPNANADSFRPKGRKGTESTATVPTLTEAEIRLAERLTARFGAEATLDDVRSDEAALVGLMHTVG